MFISVKTSVYEYLISTFCAKPLISVLPQIICSADSEFSQAILANKKSVCACLRSENKTTNWFVQNSWRGVESEGFAALPLPLRKGFAFPMFPKHACGYAAEANPRIQNRGPESLRAFRQQPQDFEASPPRQSR
jgi:hypothetical protein